MSDVATPNLPSRDFEKTSRFCAALGFSDGWRDEGWMILKRGDLTLEFFPHPELDPLTSWFSCCLRLERPRSHREKPPSKLMPPKSLLPPLRFIGRSDSHPRRLVSTSYAFPVSCHDLG
jgi:hypothetical protein